MSLTTEVKGVTSKLVHTIFEDAIVHIRIIRGDTVGGGASEEKEEEGEKEHEPYALDPELASLLEIDEDGKHGTLLGMSMTKCPHDNCGAWYEKNAACNWVACGLVDAGKNGEKGGRGCGRQFCFQCGLKLCGEPMVDPVTFAIKSVSRNHNGECNCKNDGTYCPGGHNSHCNVRWKS